MTMTMARAGNRSAAEAESFSKRDRRHRPSSWTPSHHKIATDAVACAEAIAPERAKLGQMQAELRQNLQNCHTPGPIEATEVRRASSPSVCSDDMSDARAYKAQMIPSMSSITS